MRKILTVIILTVAFAASAYSPATAAGTTPERGSSIIIKHREYLCGQTVTRRPCWYTVKTRVCYRNTFTQRRIGCTPWRIYATWARTA